MNWLNKDEITILVLKQDNHDDMYFNGLLWNIKGLDKFLMGKNFVF
ncbi:MAG: hypothetical protein JXR70_17970 [Spirochaetales bacterium]|nr:hypothetical protein [Spirochaetales bacterium]